jgi:outer membrane cobalamin receptor
MIMYSFIFVLSFFLQTPSAVTPPPVTEEVTVVGDRWALQPEPIQIISQSDLERTPTKLTDDALRQLAGFQLFRRSSSRTANPTSQGASIRGIGSNGASRVLVLNDGIPLNDPFGGWIYWGRIPKNSLASIEVFRGGGSDLFGSNALGGIINMVPKSEETWGVDFDVNGGNQGTSQIYLDSTANVLGSALRFSGERYESEGYVLPAPEFQGAVDRPAGSQHNLLELSADWGNDSDRRFFVRGDYFDEDRSNGTVLQINSTVLRQFSSGFTWNTSPLGKFTSRFFGGTQQFNQQFSAVTSDRNSEFLSSSQKVKSTFTGFSLDWLSSDLGIQTLQAGFDGRVVRGEVHELIADSDDSGGRQKIFGIFLHDRIALSDKFDLTIGTRFDSWWNTELESSFARTEDSWSPRISLHYTVSDSIEFFASAYRAFRAPTLNELYRPFQVGNTITLENADLDAEKLNGIEGTYSQSLSRFLQLRATVFLMDVQDAIGNRTISFSPAQIVRHRENIGTIRSKGLEFEARSELNNSTQAIVRYQLTNSRIHQSSVSTLEGLHTPQVPSHLVSFEIDRKWINAFSTNFQGRYSSGQFEDDLNRFLLENYFTADLSMLYQFNSNWGVFGTCENIFNKRYELGLVPYPTLGAPRLFQVGISGSIR